ncbi:hypothetical protein AAC387_Pa06g1399 [Persea americana]
MPPRRTRCRGEEPLVHALDIEEDSNTRLSSSQDEKTNEDPVLLLAKHFIEMYEKRRRRSRSNGIQPQL